MPVARSTRLGVVRSPVAGSLIDGEAKRETRTSRSVWLVSASVSWPNVPVGRVPFWMIVVGNGWTRVGRCGLVQNSSWKLLIHFRRSVICQVTLPNTLSYLLLRGNIGSVPGWLSESRKY